MKPQNTVLNSVTQFAINGHTPIVWWYPYRQKQFLNSRVCFNVGHVLKVATIKGKNMLPHREHILSLKSSPL